MLAVNRRRRILSRVAGVAMMVVAVPIEQLARRIGTNWLLTEQHDGRADLELGQRGA
jgi:hypothetical protein